MWRYAYHVNEASAGNEWFTGSLVDGHEVDHLHQLVGQFYAEGARVQDVDCCERLSGLVVLDAVKIYRVKRGR